MSLRAFLGLDLQKKDGSWQLHVEYQRLNDVIIQDVYPLLNIGKLTLRHPWPGERVLAGAMDEDAQEKSAFATCADSVSGRYSLSVSS